MRTSSCIATLALRMRVSMSAMGSVMVMSSSLPSPAGLGHARQLAGVGELAQAHAAETELAVDGAGPATATAAGVAPHLELRRALLLLDERLLGHYCCPSRLKGNPKASSRALPSAFVRAVVTMVMSMPMVTSTLS